jgi:hypothetical protein
MTQSFFAGVAGLTVLFHEETKNITKKIADDVYYTFYRDIKINKEDSPKTVFAIKEHLRNKKDYPSLTFQEIEIIPSFNNTSFRYTGSDGHNELNYEIANGTYKIKNDIWHKITNFDCYISNYISRQIGHSVAQPVYYKFEDKYITISVQSIISEQELYDYIDKIYKTYCVPEKITTYFTSNEDKWSFPIIRRSRDITKINITNEMQKVIDNIDEFIDAEQVYYKNGNPYKKGYLIKGKPGTGKTSIIEYTAIKHNMCIYLVNLNSKNMTDSVLINLLSDIPPHSIIVFEEIDRQIETLNKNNNKFVSEGGILTAIDGPQRLSHGTIVIMTSNNTYKFTESFREALFRKGRIDEVINI